jgi:proline dehydrogenase
MVLNKIIVSTLPLLPEKFIWMFSKRYIAGVDLDDVINISGKFNNNGIKVSIDLLGEYQTRDEKIDFYRDNYLQVIDEAEKHKLDTTFSLKPTMFGLLTNNKKCYTKIREIVKKATDTNHLVRIDMEDSQCTDYEIELFRKLYNEFPENTGLVFQSYLKRTLDDLKALGDLNKNECPLNIRLCKGIYIESKDIAYKKHNEINDHFINDLEYMFRNNYYAAIATHDKELINNSLDLIKKYNISSGKYEFQMLYGVTPKLRNLLVQAGHPMRIYVPFGKDWFNYSTRRLKENPKLMSHLIKALFIRQ